MESDADFLVRMVREQGNPVGFNCAAAPEDFARILALAKAGAAAKTEPAPDDDGWIPWAGGECPELAGIAVRVWYRHAARPSQLKRPASVLRWLHNDDAGDIIAYRIIKEPDNG